MSRINAADGGNSETHRAFVSVARLRKSFGSTTALKGVAFDVEKGCTVSLLGPSGCGKTTVLRSIAGLERPDEGSIRIGEETVYDSARSIDRPPEQRHIGMVFQSYAVWPHMSVAQNVGFPLKIRRVGAAETAERVAAALDLVGLHALGERPATHLSGGQQQRVALARAIVHEPRLVLFDEPLSNLDARLRQQMRTELKLLQDRLGFTAIYVTHDQEEALALSSQVIVMNLGRVEAMAAPRELFARPQTAFVAHFLGFDNILDGTVETGSARGADGSAADAGRIAIVLADGVRLNGCWHGAHDARAGMPVTVAFRSECVRLVPACAAGHGNARGRDLAAGREHDPAERRGHDRARGERHDAERLEHPHAESHGHNGFDGCIEASVYLGASIDYLVAAGGLTLRVTAPGDMSIATGSVVRAGVHPDDCIVYPRESS